MKAIIVFLLYSCCGVISAQVKFERESRIAVKEVPKVALEFLEELEVDTKVKWYLEESQEGTTYEAKFKLHGLKNSLEFDRNGDFMDLEIQMDFEDLPRTARKNMKRYLSQSTQKYKICKVQEQIVADLDKLEELMEDFSYTDSTMLIRYELIVETKRKGQFQELEALFDHNGSFLQESILIPSNTDNLEF